ncbi:MAG: hypothetical protein GDA54_02270 [Alphaproteobacteria bacterium GM7ARS4]|nr:hypothetical protein [Alphaproteobacteria bacterium GM7ARS4]
MPPTKKRLAILYSGQPRDLRACAQNHIECLHKPNPQWHKDVFAHIWYDPDSDLSNDAVHNAYLQPCDRDIEPFIRTTWKPKAFTTEKPKTFSLPNVSDAFHEKYRIPVVMSLFTSLQQANRLKKDYEKKCGMPYDCVLRLRTDSYFLKPLILDEYDATGHHVYGIDYPFTIRYHFKGLRYCKRRMLYRKTYRTMSYPVISDNFAFGSSKAMDVFAMTSERLPHDIPFYQERDVTHGEIWPVTEFVLSTTLHRHGIPIIATQLPVVLYRWYQKYHKQNALQRRVASIKRRLSLAP